MYKPILFDLFHGELFTSFKTLSSHRRSRDGASGVWTQLAQYDKKEAWKYKFEFPFILSLVILFFVTINWETVENNPWTQTFSCLKFDKDVQIVFHN